MQSIYRQKSFIIFGPSFDYMPVGATYLAKALSKDGYQVIYLEQPNFLFLLKHPFYFCKAATNVLFISRRNIRRKIVRIIIFSHALPLRRKKIIKKFGLGFLYSIQNKVVNYQIRRIKNCFRGIFDNSNVYIIFNDPFSYKTAEKLNPFPIIYRACDRYDNYPGWENRQEIVNAIDKKATEGSNIIITTSEYLFSLKSKEKTNVFLLPNGYDELSIQKLKTPSEMKRIKKPIIGFVGSFNKWIDTDLLEKIAQKRPNYSFVIIGPINNSKTRKLLKQRNIYFLGYKDRKILANYYRGFDVAIAPFIINDLTRGINPIKFYEYLAFGLPVISTPIEECKYFGELIYTAENPEKFATLLDKALQENDNNLREKRRNFAHKNTWRTRIQDLINILDSYSR